MATFKHSLSFPSIYSSASVSVHAGIYSVAPTVSRLQSCTPQPRAAAAAAVIEKSALLSQQRGNSSGSEHKHTFILALCILFGFINEKCVTEWES